MEEQELVETIENQGITVVDRVGRSSSHAGACYRFETDQGPIFVKTCPKASSHMLWAEAEGLKLIAATSTVRVPEVFLVGEGFLVMEALDLVGSPDQGLLGEQLAKMHLTPGSDQFGLDFDNTLGPTLQRNTWNPDWVDFFMKERLLFQADLLKDAELTSLIEKLNIRPYFEGIEVEPALLHGDLWGGNVSGLPDGTPVIYDPAVYYGHAEAELSITFMFGGFSQAFYNAYHALIPKQPGFEERTRIYQLYHYLNHYTIFGSSYRSACTRLASSV